jgi:uncharacterized protein YkwD
LLPRSAQTRRFTCLNLIAAVAVGGVVCAGLLALGYTAFAFPPVRNGVTAFQHYNAALDYSQRRECDKAAAEFEEVARLDGLGLYPDAPQRLAEARACQKENHYARGVAAMNAADWQQAVDEFAIVVALDPDYRDAQAKMEEARRQISPTPPPTSTPPPTGTLIPIPPTNTPVPIPPTETYTPVDTPGPTTTTPPPEAQLIALINQERGSQGLPPLAYSELLSSVARAHSQDMLARDFVDHINPDGLTPFDRLERAAYRYSAAAENIAAGHGQASAADALNSWLNSPGHRKNVLNPEFSEIGIGYAQGGKMEHYWTGLFARPLE